MTEMKIDDARISITTESKGNELFFWVFCGMATKSTGEAGQGLVMTRLVTKATRRINFNLNVLRIKFCNAIAKFYC